MVPISLYTEVYMRQCDSDTNKKLNEVSKAILRLVATIDKNFNLTNDETDIVIHNAWNCLNKVLDKRYKELHNKVYINKNYEP